MLAMPELELAFPATPPPPPADSATMPCERSPCVETVPAPEIVTDPAAAAVPPLPPSAYAPVASDPAPPPPAMDIARMPIACCPVVPIWPVAFDTVVEAAAPELPPPLPPAVPPPALPAAPPDPERLSARIPCEACPVVESTPALVTLTAPAAPPAPPRPADAESASALPPLPPLPPWL